jgi:uncharacterized protein YecE (DUF72 family)
MAETSAEILVGTAGWTDPTLIKSKRFYPAEAKTPEQRLRFYAEQFPIVEVDSSFYALPQHDVARDWADRTPDDFRFDIKAFRIFTLHQTPIKALPSELRPGLEPRANKSGNVYYADLTDEEKAALWQMFKDALEPLRAAGKLGYLLFQFPAWEFKNEGNFRHIEEWASRLEGYTVAVEFRNTSWLKDGYERETLARLREQNLAFVAVDEPQGFHSSVPAIWEATSPDLSVVRFHGRNTETWMKKGLTAAERFNYLYSDEELAELAKRTRELASKTRQVHAMFNNCYEDKAQRNATRFIELLRAS